MPLIDSCNIACGGHAGDNGSMIECVEISIRNKVKLELIHLTQIKLILKEKNKYFTF